MKKILSIFIFAVLFFVIIFNGIHLGNYISHSKHRSIDFLSEREILEIAFDHLNIVEGDISSLEIELDHEENCYDISFDVKTVTYYFEIHSTNGEIIEFNQENN